MPSGRQNSTVKAFEILAGTELFAETKLNSKWPLSASSLIEFSQSFSLIYSS